MNRQTAIGLIVGCIFAVATAFFTKDYSYYVSNIGGQSFEISKESYDLGIYPDGRKAENRISFRRESKYSTVFILVSLIGGIGIGSLLGGYLENRKNKL